MTGCRLCGKGSVPDEQYVAPTTGPCANWTDDPHEFSQTGFVVGLSLGLIVLASDVGVLIGLAWKGFGL